LSEEDGGVTIIVEGQGEFDRLGGCGSR